jgi:hypothetical protein
MKIAINTLVTSSQKIGVGNYIINLIEHLQAIDKNNHYYIFTCPDTRHLFPLQASNFFEIVQKIDQKTSPVSVGKKILWLHTGFLHKCRSLK